MSFQPGVTTFNTLAADEQVASSIVPITIGSLQTPTANPFSFNLLRNKRLLFELNAVFTLGATGGFRFRVDNAAASQVYNCEYAIGQITTPASLPAGIFAEGDFANASAVAATYMLKLTGMITQALAADGLISFQFAQNTSDALPILLKAGATLKLVQL